MAMPDPTVLLQSQPAPALDPLGMYVKAQQLKGQLVAQQQEQQLRAQQQQQNDLHLATQQRAQAEAEATATAVKASMEPDTATGLPKPNYEKAAGILTQGGFLDAANHMLDAATKTASGRVTLLENLAKLRDMGASHLGELALNAQRQLASGMPPAQVQSMLVGHLAVAGGDGVVTEKDARGFLDQVKGLPPDALPKVLDQFITPAQRKATADEAKAAQDLVNSRTEGQIKTATLAGMQGGLTADQQADNARQAAAAAEAGRHNRVMEARPVGGAASAAASQDSSDVKESVRGMSDGSIPPVLPSRASREYTALMAEAHRQGVNLVKLNEDWNATQKYLSTLNGSQQVRLRQAVSFTKDSLPIVEDLAKQWDAGRFPLLNKGNLALAKGGAFGQAAASLATKLEAQISDLTSELGTVYKGGNSSTDESLALAAKNLNANWSKQTLLENVAQIRKNLEIRENSIRLGAPVANEGNPYAPKTAAPAAGRTRVVGPNGQTGTVPAGTPLPDGWKAQ